MWSEIVADPLPPSLPEAHSITAQYFSTVHEWFPVVARRRLTRLLDNCTEIVSADLTALLYVMQLLCTPGLEASEVTYHAVKAALTACEHHNQLTTDYAAAQVLIAVFELGQSRFPIAYFTIAHCSRIFFALGTHDKRKATQLFGALDTWTEVEERRRLWWATIILDRISHTGFRFRPLAIDTIPTDEIIPAWDDEWDNGELTVNPLLVMSIETNSAVGPFARTCQAAHLLGKVCSHVNEHPTAEDVQHHLEEAVQICRAVSALKLVVEHDHDTSQKPYRLFTAKALCLSALQLLYDVHSCIEVDHVESQGGNRGLRIELQQMAIDGSKMCASECVTFAQQLLDHTALHGSASISPFVLNCLYSAAGTFAWYHRETGNQQHLDRLNDLRLALTTISGQYQACFDYLGLLDKTEFTYTGGCFQ